MERGRKKKDKTKDTQLHIAIARKDKEEATRILEECGTTINSVVEMLLKYIINHKGIPFAVELPKDMVVFEDIEISDDKISETSIKLQDYKPHNSHLDEEISVEEIEKIERMEYSISDKDESAYNFDNLFNSKTEDITEKVGNEENNDNFDNEFIGNEEEIQILKSFLSTV